MSLPLDVLASAREAARLEASILPHGIDPDSSAVLADAAAEADVIMILLPDTDLPSEALGTRYEPRDGDLVQLTLAGEVYVDVSTCGHCGNPSDASWTVVMDSGDEYEFSLEDLGRMQVRVITTNREVGEETR